MLYTTILLYELIEFIILKLKKIKVNNFLLASFTSAILSIPIYLIMFLPIFYKMGEKMIITFIIMLITFIIVQIIHYKLITYKEIHLDILAFIFIITTYIVMGILTYYPPEIDLFFDTKNEKYGINKYII